MLGRLGHSCARGCCVRTAARGNRGDGAGLRGATTAAAPPPPPTVAPPVPPERKPKERSAFRQRRKTDEQRAQELAAAAAQQQAAQAGREVFLSADALAERAAAVAAVQQQQQQQLLPGAAAPSAKSAQRQAQASARALRRAVLQPLLALLPELEDAVRQRSSGSAGGSGAHHHQRQHQHQQPRSSVPRLLLIDGYNLLHFHPATKAMIAAGQIDAARATLNHTLRQYAAQQGLFVLVAYDAVSLAAPPQQQQQPQAPQQQQQRRRRRASASGGRGGCAAAGEAASSGGGGGGAMRASSISLCVKAVFQAGTEADTVIIALVQQLLDREAAAAAAGQLGPLGGGPLVSVAVHTNDNRIQAACTEAAMRAGQLLMHHAVSVTCHDQKLLSEELAQVERKQQQHAQLHQHQPRQGFDSSSSGVPNPATDPVGWVQFLVRKDEQQRAAARAAAAAAAAARHAAAAAPSKAAQARQRAAQRERELREAQQQVLAAGLDDEALLLAAGAAADASAVAVVGASPVSDNAADVPAAPGAVSSSALLDEVLSLDLDSL